MGRRADRQRLELRRRHTVAPWWTQETVEVLQYIERLDAWLDITAFPTEGGLTVYLKNVTEREMSRRALEESAGHIEAQAALLNLARDAIIVRRLDGSLEFWNAAAEQSVRIHGRGGRRTLSAGKHVRR